MQWVTRARPKVDRIACPWVVRCFVHAETEFLYVPAEQVLTVTEQTGAIHYDVSGSSSVITAPSALSTPSSRNTISAIPPCCVSHVSCAALIRQIWI